MFVAVHCQAAPLPHQHLQQSNCLAVAVACAEDLVLVRQAGFAVASLVLFGDHHDGPVWCRSVWFCVNFPCWPTMHPKHWGVAGKLGSLASWCNAPSCSVLGCWALTASPPPSMHVADSVVGDSAMCSGVGALGTLGYLVVRAPQRCVDHQTSCIPRQPLDPVGWLDTNTTVSRSLTVSCCCCCW